MMRVEDVYPKDPYKPTVKYAGAHRTPFTVPWAAGRAQIGAGFNTQRGETDALFMKRSAFQGAVGTPLQFRECQVTSMKDESQTDTASSSENDNFAISASVGGSLLGASGRGSFEKRVQDNQNRSNINVRAEHVCGQIDTVSPPDLDIEAVKLLYGSSDPVKEFCEAYGDFYVAGYRVGAVNHTIISGQLVNKSFFQAKRAELEVKAFFTFHKSINDVQRSASDAGALRVDAYDSLAAVNEDFTAYNEEDGNRVVAMASENRQRAMTIGKRATRILYERFSLYQGCALHQDTVDRLCDEGHITELLLAPFASLRQYQSILSLRDSRR